MNFLQKSVNYRFITYSDSLSNNSLFIHKKGVDGLYQMIRFIRFVIDFSPSEIFTAPTSPVWG